MRFWLSLFLVAVFCGRASAQTNDSFANRLTLSGSNPTAVSNNLRATHETNEPNHAGASVGRSLWYTWTAPTSGTVNISTFATGTGAPTMRTVAVYTGNTFATLAEAASSNNQAQGYYTSGIYYYGDLSQLPFLGGTSVNLAATAGTVYQIAVDALPLVSWSGSDDGTTVLTINAPPTILSAASVTGTTGVSFSYAVLASGGATAYAATGLPAGLVCNVASGQITGVVTATGTYTVGLSARGPGGTGTATLMLRIADPVPVVSVVPVVYSDLSARAYVGVAFSYSIYATGSPTTYTATNLPAGLSLNASTGAISGTPTAVGATAVPISATGVAGTGTGTVTIVVETPPLPIITSSLSATGTTGSSLYYYIYTNLDGYTGLAPTSYAATNLPPGLTLASSPSNYIAGTPTQAGVYTVPISVTNATGTRQAIATFTISDPVPTPPTPVTTAPVLTSRPYAFGIVGTAFRYTLTATKSPTSFGASSLPTGVTFDATSGALTGTPTTAGTFLVPVTATNAFGVSTGTLTITVAANAAAQNAAFGYPQTTIISAASTVGYTGQAFSYSIVAAYNNIDPSYYYATTSPWTFSATGLPPGLSVTGNSSYGGIGTISGTLTAAGVYQATVSAICPANTSTSNGLSVHPASTGAAVVTFIVKAGPAPVAPVITSSAMTTATVGTSTAFYLAASNSPTSYAASGLPAGISINATSGLVSGAPTTAGTFAATISATNAVGTGSVTVTFVVTQSPTPLITSAANASGAVGASFSYSLTANSGPNTYGTGALPPGLSLNATSGLISGTPTQAGIYTVPISATNAASTTNATLTLTIFATVPSHPPTITSYAAQQVTVGQSFYYDINADVTVTSYGATGLPPGTTFNASYGEISGTPTQAGTYTVPISATNAAGTGTGTLTLVVANPGLPVFTSACALSGTAGQSFSSSVSASNSPTNYTFSGLPPGLAQSSSSPGYLTGTPTQAGVYTVPVSATNPTGTTSATLTITIASATAQAPVINSPLGTVGVAGSAFQFAVQASNTPTSYTTGSLPAGLSFDASTGIVTGTPTAAGTYTLNFSATNSVGTGIASVNLVVYAASAGVPIITTQVEAIAYFKEPFYLAVNATNAPTSFTASNLPTGLSIDATTGVISGTPISYSSSASITATNAAGSSSAYIYFIVVTSPSAPHFTNAATVSAVVNQSFSQTISCNAYVSAYTATGLPTGLTYNASSGVISGTPTAVGSWTVSLSASTQYGTATGRMQIAVGSSAGTRAEIVSALGVGGSAGVPLAYAIKASNAPTGYAASGLPAGLTLNPATGVISGTPTTTGTTAATITATNAAGSTVATLTFNVTTTTQVEITSAAEVGGYVGAFLNYTVTTGPALTNWTLSAYSLPAGLTFNPTAHTISGTPTSTGSSTYYVSVYDSSGGQAASTALTFNIVAASGTQTPVLNSAAAATGAVGSSFNYTISASNATLAYTASNLLAGLSFNSSAHLISGTPTVAGTYSIPLGAGNANGTGTGTLTLTVANPAPPTLTSSYNTLERTFTLGASGSTDVSWYINATGSPTSYAASNVPPGLSLNTTTGQFTGALTTAGAYPVTVSATNASGTASAVITYVVTPATLAPPFISSLPANSNAFAGVTNLSFFLYATNSPTSYAASGLPPGLALNATSGQITGTPTVAGAYNVALSATNAAGTGTALWRVIANDPAVLYPVFSSVSAQLSGTVAGRNYYYFYAYPYYGGSSVSAPVSITVAGLPSGAQVYSTSANYLEISSTPTAAGTYPLTLTATTPSGATTTATCTLVVSSASPPVIASAAGVAGNLQNAFTYSLSANGTVSSYGVGALPPGLTFNAANSQITGTPTATGTFAVPVTATGPSGTVSAVITIRIDPPLYGGLPVITNAATASSQDLLSTSTFPFSYNPYAPPPSVLYTLTALNQPTSWTATNLPPGLTFNQATGVLAGTPITTGVFQVPVSATNASGTVNAVVTIVSNSFLAVPYTSLAASTYVGASYSSQIGAYYPAPGVTSTNLSPFYNNYYNPLNVSAASSVAYSATGLPPGLTINSYTGVVSGTPTVAGTYPITFNTANRVGSSRVVNTLVVADGAPPSIPASTPLPTPYFYSNAQAAGFVGVPLKYTLSSSYLPTYAATGLPAGITLNPSTGLISGTPTVAGAWTILVAATSTAGTATATLTLTVDPVPATPIVYADCASTANVGSYFSYNISVTNYSGEPAPNSYTVSGLPDGLTFSAISGFITGTPTGPTGTYLVPIAITLSPALAVQGTLTLTVLPALVSTTPLLTSPAGALGIAANPFSYAISNPAFVPTGTLPPGLSYDAVHGAIRGIPTAAGTYAIPLTTGGTSGTTNGSGMTHAAKSRGNAVVRPTGRRGSAVTADGGGAPTGVLTIQVIAPDFSLPRLTAQPVGGSATEGASFAFAATPVGVPTPTFQWTHNGVPLTGATGAGLTLGGLQTRDSGTYTLTASNAAGSVTSQAATLLVQTNYNLWQADNFSTQEIASGLAGDFNSFSGDGVPNLVKYALDLDPRSNVAGSALPGVSRSAADGRLQVGFARDAGKPDINYLVEASTDLGAWTVIAESDAGAPFVNAGAAAIVETAVSGTSQYQVTVKAAPPSSSGGQFLRLRIVRP